MLQKVRKIRLSDMIVNQIKDLILTKQATPGMCLGSEREMCKKLNVSRSVLREALSNLQAQGLIRSDPQGVFVESITPNSMKEPIENVLKEDKEKIFELNEVRRILESGMIALAIERATPDDIEKIKESLASLEEAYTNGQLGDEENVQFHLRLAESCHNSIYIHILYTFLNLFQKASFLYRSKLLTTPKNAKILMEHHREIYKTFIAKDPKRATKAIVDHLLWGDKELKVSRNGDKE